MYIDHVGINTNDMEATLQFYCGILGMRLVRTTRTPDRRRHYNVEIGGGNVFRGVRWCRAPVLRLITDPQAIAALEQLIRETRYPVACKFGRGRKRYYRSDRDGAAAVVHPPREKETSPVAGPKLEEPFSIRKGTPNARERCCRVRGSEG